MFISFKVIKIIIMILFWKWKCVESLVEMTDFVYGLKQTKCKRVYLKPYN